MTNFGLKDGLIYIFFIFLFCFMINRIFFFSPGVAEVSSSYVLYPILKIQKFFTDPISKYFSKKSDIVLLHQEIEILKLEKENLQSKIVELEVVSDIEQRSQEICDFSKKYDFSDQKLVQVLLRSFDDTGHFYWVDAGKNKGVCCNMIAVYKNNIIGRVIHVDALYSKISLVTDKRCKIAVACAHTKVIGIFQGHNNFEPTLEFVPHYETLEEDDLVISSGQGLIYPHGFAVGKIKKFQVQHVAYEIKIQPLVDLEQLDFVYLVNI